MHHEFAVEAYNYHAENFGENADFLFIKNWCLEPEMIDFALKNCNEKVNDIIATIKGMSGYRKPTDKQKAAIALNMLQGRSAKDILRAVYGDKVKELLPDYEDSGSVDDEDAVAKELAAHGIILSPERIAFGILSDFVADDDDNFHGNTYRASKNAVMNMRAEASRGTVDALATLVLDERIVVTMSELNKLNQEESDVLLFSSKPMELDRYIRLYYGGNNGKFAAAMGKHASKVSEWKRLGWIAYDGKLWSSKRTLKHGNQDEEVASLPAIPE